MARATGFVAGGCSRGFTLTYGLPPRWRGHLTLCLLHRHTGKHSYSFGPSSAASGLTGATPDYYDLC